MTHPKRQSERQLLAKSGRPSHAESKTATMMNNSYHRLVQRFPAADFYDYSGETSRSDNA